jgi:hypothetical protein
MIELVSHVQKLVKSRGIMVEALDSFEEVVEGVEGGSETAMRKIPLIIHCMWAAP